VTIFSEETMGYTIVRGGLVVTPGGAVRADVLIEGERIAGIVAGNAAIPADETIDASGLVVLPGAIDAHTHFIQDDPEVGQTAFEESEGFTNGGRAAAAGGVTTVVEMPQATPPTLDGHSFRRRRELAGKDAIVDFALWGGVCAGQEASALDEQAAEGAAGFKAFMCESDPTFPGVKDDQILSTLEHLKDTPYLFGLHAESDALLQAGLARMQATGRKDPLAHHESRPPIVEIEAVHRAIFFAEQTGGWVHIVHLSAPGAAELVKQAKARGVNVTAETCPQYLALDHDDLQRLKGFAKCAPAIRSRDQVEALWPYLLDGTLDCITSDHCGYTVESKERGDADIWQAPNGLSGVQTLLPVAISEGRQRGVSWEQIAELTATAPARLWHLGPRKGAIAVGADADLTFVDPNKSWTVTNEEILHTHRWSPFAGRQLTGRVVRTMLRGTTIYDDSSADRVLVQPGFGTFVPANIA
jgi:allantoinase